MATDITGTPAYIADTANVESRFSGVSWGAIIAGGVAAAALAIMLMTLGAGLGLIVVSPWPGQGASAETVGIGAIVWSVIIEVAAFGLGGYLAGRLRTKWANLHGDEVYFRDTAHGFVTWALGTLVSIFILSSAAGMFARTTAEVGGAVGATAVAGAGAAGAVAGPSMMANAQGQRGTRGNPMDYYIDLLFRPATTPAAGTTTGTTGTGTTGTGTTAGTTGTGTTTGATGATAPAATPGMAPMTGEAQDIGPARSEILHIAAASFKDGEFKLSDTDRAYVAQLVAQRTGMSQQDAEKRVDDVINQAKTTLSDAAKKAKETADTARKAGAGLAMWSVIAMLIGAFVASFAATLGGRHRDT